MDAIERGAQLIADAMGTDKTPRGARWRWGTVTARTGAKADVTVGGASVAGVTVAAGVNAPVGARVRVAYLETQAVIDASVTADEYPLDTLGGTGTNQFYARNGTATLVSAGTTPSAQWGTASVCTIPDGFRPRMVLYFPIAKTGATISDTYLQIGTDGACTLQNWGGTQAAREYRATCTWAY